MFGTCLRRVNKLSMLKHRNVHERRQGGKRDNKNSTQQKDVRTMVSTLPLNVRPSISFVYIHVTQKHFPSFLLEVRTKINDKNYVGSRCIAFELLYSMCWSHEEACLLPFFVYASFVSFLVFKLPTLR